MTNSHASQGTLFAQPSRLNNADQVPPDRWASRSGGDNINGVSTDCKDLADGIDALQDLRVVQSVNVFEDQDLWMVVSDDVFVSVAKIEHDAIGSRNVPTWSE